MTHGGAAARGTGVGRLLSRVLAAQAFLHPGWGELHSPWRMAGMEAAAARIGATVTEANPINLGAPAAVNYLVMDNNGTTRMTVNAAGTASGFATFYPYGEPGNGATSAEYEWTNQIRDSNGVDHFWHRDYASQLARWLSPDPAGLAAVSMTNPQTWNEYSYVLNDPASAVDSEGLVTIPPTPPWEEEDQAARWFNAFSLGNMMPLIDPATPLPPIGPQGGGGKFDVSKVFKELVACSSSAQQTEKQVQGNFAHFGNFSRWHGLESVQFFPPSPLRVGSNIPITIHEFVVPQHLSVTVHSLSAQSMTFHTNPGHLLYPGHITFAASSGPPGKVKFKISLAGNFPNEVRKEEFKRGGGDFENAQWNHFLSQVAAFCAGKHS